MTEKKPAGPIVIALDDAAEPEQERPVLADTAARTFDPANAPPVPDAPAGAGPGADAPPEGRAMMAATRIAARPVSWIARFFWAACLGLFVLWLSTSAWDFAIALLERNIWLGRLALAFGAIVGVTLLSVALRELAGYSRLARLDDLRRRADDLHARPDDTGAQALIGQLRGLYSRRDDMKWALANLAKSDDAIIDARDRLYQAERQLLAPLDDAARTAIEASSRQVATATAIVPLALADVAVALTANIRMVRQIAEIYGGRAGTLGSWRLIRAVATHLVATGAVGVADDMIGSVAGGGAVAKLSRRFGEGIINGALTARVGLAAMDVCRPMPFVAETKPGVTAIMRTSLTGVFAKG